MNTNDLAYFNDSVNTLIEGKLILIDKHVAQVLKCVANSPILCQVLSDTVKTMTYATEFSRARVTWTRNDGVVESRLKLPVDRNRLFTFVVCLLAEVDSGRRSILDFLKEYYNDVNNDASYAKFANEVLKPFKRAGEAILSSIDPESFHLPYLEQAEKYFQAEKIYVETSVLEQLLAQMEEIRLAINTLPVSDNERFEFNAVSEFLVNALYLKNPKILAVSYLAYKNTVAKYTVVSEQLNNVVKLMSSIS